MGKAGLRILLVEDDDVDAVLTQRYLKWANPYGELHRVRSVAEALEVFAPARFDVLLIDEYLGADYGTDLVRQGSPQRWYFRLLLSQLSLQALHGDLLCRQCLLSRRRRWS